MKIKRLLLAAWADLAHFFWPKTWRARFVRLFLPVALLIVVFLVLNYQAKQDNADDNSNYIPVVKVASARTLAKDSSNTFVGTVSAVSEVDLQFEAAGQVTSVSAKVGDFVRAGSVLATVANAGEQAAVLQARGAYDAAVASAAISSISVADTENNLSTTKNNTVAATRASFNTANEITRNTIDIFFANPNTTIPGVRIRAAETATLNNLRVELQNKLPQWQTNVNTLTADSDLPAAIDESLADLALVSHILNILITEVDNARNTDTLNGVSVQSYNATLTVAKTQINTTISSLQATKNSLTTAVDAVTKAKLLGNSDNQNSAAQAQVTQALGGLRAAQARLEKTLIRTPISGTVDVFRVKVGDYVSMNQPVALVTANNGLEVSLFIGQRDNDKFNVGQEVSIDGVATGTVVSLAAAIDPLTQKQEVKIALNNTEQFVSGDTVRVNVLTQESKTTGKVEIPITALKFHNEDGSIFVLDEGILKAQPVELGKISGGMIEILSGMTLDTEFVVDMRGLNEGQNVTVLTN